MSRLYQFLFLLALVSMAVAECETWMGPVRFIFNTLIYINPSNNYAFSSFVSLNLNYIFYNQNFKIYY